MLREVEFGLLVMLWAAGIYLNASWIANCLPRRVYTLNLWRWRLVVSQVLIQCHNAVGGGPVLCLPLVQAPPGKALPCILTYLIPG